MKNNKGIAPLIVVLIVAGILALGGGGYYAVKKYKAPATQPVVTQNQASVKVIKNVLTQEGNSLVGAVTVLVSAGANNLNIFELPFYPQFSKVEGNFQGTIGDISHSHQIIEGDFVKNPDNTTKILSGKEVTINYTVKYLPKNNIDGGTYYVNLNDGHDCINYKPENYVPVQGEEGNVYPCLKVVGQTESNKLTVQAQTADWKTYTNSQYGFEFKYPNNFQYLFVNDESNEAPIVVKVDEMANAPYYKNFFRIVVSPSTQYPTEISSSCIGAKSFGIVKIGNGTHEKYLLFNDHVNEFTTLCVNVVHSNYLFEFYADSYSKDSLIIDKILSTFKFTK